MGNTGSSESGEFKVSPKKCFDINNEEVAYRTMQMLSTQKAIEILDSVIVKLASNEELSETQVYLIDTKRLIEDIVSGNPSQISLDIFNPRPKIVGMSSGLVDTKNYTVFDRYNDFFISDYKNLNGKARVDRVNDIKSELNQVHSNLVKYLSNACSPENTKITGLPRQDVSAMINISVMTIDSDPSVAIELVELAKKYGTREEIEYIRDHINRRELVEYIPGGYFDEYYNQVKKSFS